MAPGVWNPGQPRAKGALLQPQPKMINTKDLRKPGQAPRAPQVQEPVDKSLIPVEELPDMEEMSRKDVLKKIGELKARMALCLGRQREADDKTSKDSTEIVVKLVASRVTTPTTPLAPTPSPLTSTPPRPTPSPLTSPEPEPKREDILKMNDSEFNKWVMQKSRGWGPDPKPMPSFVDDWFPTPVFTSEPPVLDVYNGGNLFSRAGFPTKIWDAANSFLVADLEAARRGYMELNGAKYDITEKSLCELESAGLYVDGLRVALYQAQLEKLHEEKLQA
ncbi:hypothetical protein TWF506_006336 [Arthrobotrys conoides]|uniref:Uncharacterized protein n=1 Tax=Arthrobotrys conoides TaxID=74498 RepID=A0AAN8P1T2_9PEZI